MALKNLFDMVKADKYTADGRETLIKAQEAETEDKVYQIGEISQTTGLQKTANGWVKPKNGKQPKAKKQEEPKNVHGAEVDKIYERQLKRIKELKAKGFTDEQIDNDKIIKQTKEDMKNVGKKPESKPAENHPPMVMPKGMSPAEFEKAWKDDAKKHGFKEGQGNEWREYLKKEAGSKPAETYRNEEGRRNFKAALEDNPTSSYDFAKTVEFAAPMSQEDKVELKKLRLFMSDEGADYKQALRSRASNLVDGNKSNGDWFPEKEKSIMKIAKAVGYDKELHKFIEEEYKGYDLGYSEDAAPRVLSGDTKIRVRKA